jgi:hypothetical protein
MKHIFINFGHISLIVSDLERYDVGLPEYKIKLRNIHEISTQGVMIPGTLFPNFHHLAFQGG